MIFERYDEFWISNQFLYLIKKHILVSLYDLKTTKNNNF